MRCWLTIILGWVPLSSAFEEPLIKLKDGPPSAKAGPPTRLPGVPSNSPTRPSPLPSAPSRTGVPVLVRTRVTFPPTSKPTDATSFQNALALLHSVRTKYDIDFSSTQQRIYTVQNFLKSLNTIHKLNTKSNLTAKHAVRFGLNEFSVLNVSSFSKNYKGVIIPEKKLQETTIVVHGRPKNLLGMSPAPILKDWSGVLTTPIKNQAGCGCCYIFSAISQVESDSIRISGQSNQLSVSVQQALDCGGFSTIGGCNGGFPLGVYFYIERSIGVTRDALYPYVQKKQSSCQLTTSAPVVVGVLNHYILTSNTEADMAVYVQNTGPLSILVYAEQWRLYKGGVMTAAICAYNGSVDHAVQLVGVDLSDPSNQYWIVRRSI